MSSDDERPVTPGSGAAPRRVGRAARLEAVIDRHDAKEAAKSTGRVARHGARWMGAANLGGQLTRVGATVALARLLSPEVFGLVALVTVVTAFFERVLGDTGTSAAIVREPTLTQRLASSVFWFNVGVGSTTTLMFVTSAPLVARVLGNPDADDIVRGLGCMAVINAFAYVPFSMLKRHGRFRNLAIVNYANVAVTATTSIALAAAGWGAWALVAGNLAGSVVWVVLIWATGVWRPSLHFAVADMRLVSRFSFNLSAYNFFGYFIQSGDRFVVGRFVGTAALGYYGMANRLLRYPVQASVAPYRDVILPMLSRLQDDHRTLGRVYVRSLGALAFAVMPITATVAVVSGPLVTTFLGDKWEPAVPIVSIIALVATLQALNITTGSLYTVTGHTDKWLYWGIFSALLTMVGYSVGAIWGEVGVAWGFLVAIAALTYPGFRIPFNLIGLKVRVLVMEIRSTVLATGVAAAAAAAARFGIESVGARPVWQLAGGVAASGICYGAYALAFRPRAFRDLLSLVRKEKGVFGVGGGRSEPDSSLPSPAGP